jgi:hypothetical protein
MQVFRAEVDRCLSAEFSPKLADSAGVARAALAHADSWLATARNEGQPALEAGARRFAMTLGRIMELVLLINHAQWSEDHEADHRATASARRFAGSGIDLLNVYDPEDVSILFRDQ